jgi:membrane protein
MSIKSTQLRFIESKIRALHDQETKARSKIARYFWQSARWAGMLWHEFVRDDLLIRAESLSYFTLFSIMPLLAGAFLFLNFFSQWAPVQEEFQNFLNQVTEPIPEEHRQALLSFVLDFKKQYLISLDRTSASIGIFALGLLLWIVIKVFRNIEDLMNRIWSVYDNRGWFERVQSFLFCAILFPLISTIALSLPGIMKHFAGKQVGLFTQSFLPIVIIFFSLSFIFRYLPNAQVRWKSAFSGAGFSTASFVIANFLLKIYFHFGTQTAYGKAGVVPIFAFFIYVLWLVFILGAEISFIVQNQSRFSGRVLPKTTIGEATLLIETLRLMQTRFNLGLPLLSANDIASHFAISIDSVMGVILFLQEKGALVLTLQRIRAADSAYALKGDISHLDLGRLIKDYLDIDLIEQNFDVKSAIKALSTN